MKNLNLPQTTNIQQRPIFGDHPSVNEQFGECGNGGKSGVNIPYKVLTQSLNVTKDSGKKIYSINLLGFILFCVWYLDLENYFNIIFWSE